MMKPETMFREREVIPFLKNLRHTAYFPIQQRSLGGDPDFIICCFGRFVALELKSSGGKLSKLQEFKKTWVEHNHGVWITASPETWVHAKNRLTLISDGLYP